MLIFTNRLLEGSDAAASLSTRFTPGAEALTCAHVQRAGSGFQLADARADVADDEAMLRLVPLFQGTQPVLVYLHGNNNRPRDCFERCARLEESYGVEVVGFSWPSEGLLSSGVDVPDLPAADNADHPDDEDDALAGVSAGNRKEGWAARKIRRYRQAKVNAQDSGDALARFLRLLAAARLYANGQRMSLAAHSLGCHFLQYAIEHEGASEALAAAHNIALLAACCRAEGHASWVSKLAPKGQTFITYNKGDSVLFGAYIADGSQVKLGTEPGARLVHPRVRYVSFTDAPLSLGGHRYFVADAGKKLPKAARRLFERVFHSERDIRDDQGERPNQVYPVGCDTDGSTCYMARPLS
jgi:hypothetical protein